MKVIVAGSRDYTNYKQLVQVLNCVKYKITEVVSGTARGADKLGERWAKANKIPVKPFPADWDKYGKSAGYKRNKQMAEYGDALIAFWDGTSTGTANMIELAEEHKLPVTIIDIETNMPFTKVTFKTNKEVAKMEHEAVELTYEFDGNKENVEDVYDAVRETALDLLGIRDESKKAPFDYSPPKTFKKGYKRSTAK